MDTEKHISMSLEIPVDPEQPATAPPDGMAKFLASRTVQAPALVAPAAEPTPEPVAETDAAPVTDVEPVLDPETDQPIPNPTRNDRRIAKLWKREQAALAEVDRLTKMLEDRERSRPVASPPEPAGRPQTAGALSPDQALDAAAKARVRPEPDERQIGQTYATYEAWVKDHDVWAAEYVAEKRAILAEQQTIQQQAAENQRQFAEHYHAQAAEYPDFEQKIRAAEGQDVGETIGGLIINTPELAGHLTYWCATHRDEVERIKALPPARQVFELGKVTAGLSATTAKPAGAASPKPSRAPAPTGEIGRPAGPASSRLEDATSMSDFLAKRNAQLSAQRSAQRR